MEPTSHRRSWWIWTSALREVRTDGVSRVVPAILHGRSRFASWKWRQLLGPRETRSLRVRRKTADRTCLRYKGCIEGRLSGKRREPLELFNASDASKQRFAHL